jgi:hypothetical protein
MSVEASTTNITSTRGLPTSAFARGEARKMKSTLGTMQAVGSATIAAAPRPKNIALTRTAQGHFTSTRMACTNMVTRGSLLLARIAFDAR